MSQVADNESTSEQSLRRREALSLNLRQLEGTRRRGVDLRKTLDGVELNAWELDQLAQGLDESSEAWRTLIVEGVALRNKLAADIGSAVNSGVLKSEEASELTGLLVANTAVAIALLAETQSAINQLVLAGEIDDAKKLTNFRNKIGQSVQDLKTRVGAGGFSVAEEMSEAFITPAAGAWWTRRVGGSIRAKTNGTSWDGKDEEKLAAFAAAEESHRRTKAKPAEAQAVPESDPPVNRLKPLLMILGVSVVVWAVFILPRMTVKPLPVLELQDVTPRSEIRQVVARPPSLFVELDRIKWQALSNEGQLALVDEVGRTAAAAGYHGVNFTAGDGRTKARWLKKRGSELVE